MSQRPEPERGLRLDRELQLRSRKSHTAQPRPLPGASQVRPGHARRQRSEGLTPNRRVGEPGEAAAAGVLATAAPTGGAGPGPAVRPDWSWSGGPGAEVSIWKGAAPRPEFGFKWREASRQGPSGDAFLSRRFSPTAPRGPGSIDPPGDRPAKPSCVGLVLGHQTLETTAWHFPRLRAGSPRGAPGPRSLRECLAPSQPGPWEPRWGLPCSPRRPLRLLSPGPDRPAARPGRCPHVSCGVTMIKILFGTARKSPGAAPTGPGPRRCAPGSGVASAVSGTRCAAGDAELAQLRGQSSHFSSTRRFLRIRSLPPKHMVPSPVWFAHL